MLQSCRSLLCPVLQHLDPSSDRATRPWRVKCWKRMLMSALQICCDSCYTSMLHSRSILRSCRSLTCAVLQHLNPSSDRATHPWRVKCWKRMLMSALQICCDSCYMSMLHSHSMLQSCRSLTCAVLQHLDSSSDRATHPWRVKCWKRMPMFALQSPRNSFYISCP
jgi:hypothetical protein